MVLRSLPTVRVRTTTLVTRFWRRFLPDLVQRADLSIFRRISETHHPAGDTLLPRLSRAANHSRLWMAIAGMLAVVGGRRERRASMRGMLAVGIASFVANVPAKVAVNRMRPQLEVPLARRLARLPTSTSFPSGHSASAFAFAAGMSLEKPGLAPLIFPLASAVAYSRIYTGVHYPTDVVVGSAIGVGAALVTRRIWPKVPEEPARTHPVPSRSVLSIDPDGRGVTVVVNPRAGNPRNGIAGYLQEALPGAEIVELPKGAELRTVLRGAADRCEVLGIAGGDGSVSTAAAVALERTRPLLVVPSGTLNRFARDLGIETVDDAVRAAKAATTSEVDVGRIDGEVFVNTASVGAYVALVEARRHLEKVIGRWPAGLVALIRILRTTEPVLLEVDGKAVKAWLVFFGNCRYLPDGLAPASRCRLEDGRVDVRVIHASDRFSKLRLVWAVLTGTLPTSGMYQAKLTERPVRVRFLQGPPPLARDGEILDGPTAFTVSKSDTRLVVLLPGG